MCRLAMSQQNTHDASFTEQSRCISNGMACPSAAQPIANVKLNRIIPSHLRMVLILFLTALFMAARIVPLLRSTSIMPAMHLRGVFRTRIN